MAPRPPLRTLLASVDEVFTNVLLPARRPHTAPVSVSATHLPGEPVTLTAALALPFAPFPVGGRWGPLWGTTWFHVQGRVPTDWAGRPVVLLVDLGHDGMVGFGAEGLVWRAGQPVQGISPNHRDVWITSTAAGGEDVDLHIEAAANPDVLADQSGRLLLPEPGGEPMLELRRCHLAVPDTDVEALTHDWKLVREVATRGDETRRQQAADALRDASEQLARLGATADALDQAGSLLGDVLSAVGEGGRFTHLAAGNSHIDTAWLWPLRETRRKVVRTFSTACTMLDREPDYGFAASQAQQLAWIRDDHPDLWERIRAHVDAGRFEVVGNTWVEPDCNLPSGESLVRQIVHGRRFFRDEMGVDAPGLWLPDTFGYSAALPQILAQAGIEWFMTQKISWNETNRFPHHSFWWEGIDGSRIFTHLPPADTYNGNFSLPNLLHAERNFDQRDHLTQALYLYGHGDGGGGPDTAMLERARRLADLADVGQVELTGAGDAMERIRAEATATDLPVWVGELYLEKHRGTYTTHGATKRANRELEGMLREAEMWSLAAHFVGDVAIDGAGLDAAWKVLLLHQFHDIIPGTSIHWVHRDTAEAHAALRADLQQRIDDALAEVATSVAAGERHRPVLVANSLPFARDELVDIDGELHRVSAPACGWQVNDLPYTGWSPAPVAVGDTVMDNGILRVTWDDAGLVTSLVHHDTGREAIARGGRANRLQLMEDTPAEWDAWDIDRAAFDTAVDLLDAERVEVIESTPWRATLLVVRSFGDSRIEQRMQLAAGSSRLEFHNDIHWHEDHKLLKVAFPLSVRSPVARHEIQFGHVQRPTHRNTSWDEARFETCAHTWVDLSDDEFGVALLNDGKYGHDVLGGEMRLSLLRAPTWPDPLADRGRHRFAYALYPHVGPPTTGGVIEQAHAFNSPLRVVPLDGAGPAGVAPDRYSLVEPSEHGVVVSALKPADDGDGFVLRLHEAYGTPRSVDLTVAGLASVEVVDLLEDPIDAPAPAVNGDVISLDLRPFQLITLRLRRRS